MRALLGKILKIVLWAGLIAVGLGASIFISFIAESMAADEYYIYSSSKYEGFLIPIDHAGLLLRKKFSGDSHNDCKLFLYGTEFCVIRDRNKKEKPAEYETVSMGRYPQEKEEEEPIEWLVIDKKCGRTLLLSKYYLDAVSYDNKMHNISWAESQLREWLNGDFYHRAFSKEEQKEIRTSLIESDMYTFYGWDEEVCPSRMTRDKIFVLDPHEKLIYLTMTGNDYHSKPTEYAKKRAGSDIKRADWSRFGAVPNIACQKSWSSWPAGSTWTEPGDYGPAYFIEPREDANYMLYVRPAMWVDSGYVRKLKERQ